MLNRRLRVVILNFNRSDLTRHCVQSVLDQQFHGSLDIVVVDNGSSHSEFARLKAVLDPKVALVRSESNLGYAAGNNLGVRTPVFPPPDFLMVVNNDVLLTDKRTCQRLVETLHHSRAVACSPLVDTAWQGSPAVVQLQVRRVPSFMMVLVSASWWMRRCPGLRRYYESYTYQDARPYRPDELYECDSINGSCFVIRYDYWLRIGGFDEGTFLYYEELILGHQIRSDGLTALLDCAVTVKHEQGATTGLRRQRASLRRLRQQAQSESYYCRRYLGVPSSALKVLSVVRIIDMSSKLGYQCILDITVRAAARRSRRAVMPPDPASR